MTDRDNITLPREVVKLALEAFEAVMPFSTTQRELKIRAVEALRTHLAAPKQEPEPVAWLSRDAARLALWKAINGREFGNPTDDKLILDHLRQQGLWIGKVAPSVLAAPPALAAPTVKESLTHPGYVIGSHWLETAYSRICAGEAEADVLRDCGWERVDEALRRDAERYRWLRERAWFQFEFEGRYGDSGETVQELDVAIDAAMEGKR